MDHGYINATLHADAHAIRLCRIDSKERGHLYEPITFSPNPRAGCEKILRRAVLCGRVEFEGDNQNHFADILDAGGSGVQCVALDPKSWRYLKEKMRCRIETSDQ